MCVMGTQVLQEQQAASNLSTDPNTFLNVFICFASLSLTYRTHDLVFSLCPLQIANTKFLDNSGVTSISIFWLPTGQHLVSGR